MNIFCTKKYLKKCCLFIQKLGLLEQKMRFCVAVAGIFQGISVGSMTHLSVLFFTSFIKKELCDLVYS